MPFESALGSFWDSTQSSFQYQVLQRYHHATAVHNGVTMYIFGGYRPDTSTTSTSTSTKTLSSEDLTSHKDGSVNNNNNNNNNNKQYQSPQKKLFVPTNDFLEYNLETGEYRLLNDEIDHEVEECVVVSYPNTSLLNMDTHFRSLMNQNNNNNNKNNKKKQKNHLIYNNQNNHHTNTNYSTTAIQQQQQQQHNDITIDELFSLMDSSPSECPSLAQHSMVLVGDNYLYIFGGKTSDGSVSNQLYRYDILRNVWTHIVPGSKQHQQQFLNHHNNKKAKQSPFSTSPSASAILTDRHTTDKKNSSQNYEDDHHDDYNDDDFFGNNEGSDDVEYGGNEDDDDDEMHQIGDHYDHYDEEEEEERGHYNNGGDYHHQELHVVVEEYMEDEYHLSEHDDDDDDEHDDDDDGMNDTNHHQHRDLDMLHDQQADVYPYLYGHSAVTVDDCNIYIFGGSDGNQYFNNLYILNVETMECSLAVTQGTPPEPRSGHSCVLYANEELFVFGGGNDEKTFNDLYSLNLYTLTWKKEITKGQNEPVKRIYHSANVVANKMILLGGDIGNRQSSQSNLMILDLDTKRWDYGLINNHLVHPPPVLYGHTSVLSGTKLWVAGGRDASIDETNSDCVSKSVYSLDTGIQGIEPIDFGRNNLAADLQSLVNHTESSDITFEYCEQFYCGHRAFLRIRCPVLHQFYMRNCVSNDSNLNVNEAIQALAMKKMHATDLNNRKITQSFSRNMCAFSFMIFLQYLYTDEIVVPEEEAENNQETFEVALRDVAFMAELFEVDRLYALCAQQIGSLELKGQRKLPHPTLYSDMKKMFDLSQNYVDQLDDRDHSRSQEHIFDTTYANTMHHHHNSNSTNSSVEPPTPSSTVSGLTSLSTNPYFTYCDIIFYVSSNGEEYERIGAHRCVLTARSHFFNRMLSQTHASGSYAELEITAIRPRVFQLVLEFLYTGNVSITFDVAVEILIASEVYQLDRLSLMSQAVIERRIHIHNVCRLLTIADVYDIKHLRESCIFFIVHHMNQVKKTNSYKVELEPELKRELREKRKRFKSQEGRMFGSDLQLTSTATDKHKQKKKKKKARKPPKQDETELAKTTKRKKRRSDRIKHRRYYDNDGNMSDGLSQSPMEVVTMSASVPSVMNMHVDAEHSAHNKRKSLRTKK